MHPDITWNQSWPLPVYDLKIGHFNIFRGSEFWIWEVFPLFEGWTKFRAQKMAKTAALKFLDSPKLISRKI